MPAPLPFKELESRIKELVRVYRNAREEIYAQLRDGALTDFQRFRMTEIKRQIEGIVAGLDNAARQTAQGIIPPMYQQGADMTRIALADQNIDVAPLNMGNQIHASAVQAVTDQMAADLMAANNSMLQQATRILRLTQQNAISDRQINELIAQGLVHGQTRREVSQRLTAELRKKVGLGDGIKITVKGEKSIRRFTPEYYAELVARTQTREAATEGSIRLGQEYGFTLYRASTHEGACPVCQEFQGKIYSVTDNPDFPKLTRRTPYHPNCTHIMTPVDADFLKDKGQYDALSKLSKDKKAVIWGSEDYDAVINGATPHREPKDWGEKFATRARRVKKSDVDIT